MKNFDFTPRATCALVWLFAFLTFFSFGQTSQVTSLQQRVVPFSYNGNPLKPRLQTFRSSTIYNPVVYSLPQSFISDFPNGLIDFGDGNGFVPIGTQTTRSINYPNFSDKALKIKKNSTISDADARMLVRINVKAQIAAYVKPDETWTIGVKQGVSWTRPASCAGAYPVGTALFNTEQKTAFNDGSIGKANVYIKYGKEKEGNTRTRLARPILFIDGIDFSSYNYKITDNSVNNTTDTTNKVIRYGDTGWDVLWTGTDESRLDGTTDREVFGNYPAAFSRLINDGYDFVFVDFERGADYIQKNGLLLMEVIRQINAKKVQNDCRAKNVVIGASMGGQVARWALKKMENAGENHDSHTYVSFDSPQKGAHIPLSIQAAAFWASRAGINTGSPSLWQKLNFPAARQLLFDNLGSAERGGRIAVGRWEVSGLVGFGDIAFVPDDFKCLRDDYVAEMAALNYPQQTRNIAIACGGSNSSPQGYGNGSFLFNMNSPTAPGFLAQALGFNANVAHFKIWSGDGAFASLAVVKAADCNANVIPASVGFGGRAGQQFIFAAAFPSSFNESIVTPSGEVQRIPCNYSTLYVQNLQSTPYFDNAPGSFRQDLIGLKQVIEDEAAAIDGANINLDGLPNATTKKQCFIPTLSAFDIQQTVSDQSLYQNFAATSLQHPFAAIFAPANNLKHVEIDNSIINFLLQQIKISEITLTSTVINRDYNFANTAKKSMTSVDIYAGGTVRVNGTGNAGFGDEVNNADASGFEVSTSSACGSEIVNVNSGGVLKIGESARAGTLKVTSGSTVRIFSNGSLNIDGNSQLIVENGGHLIIDGGANIILTGSESTIYVKSGGELVINGNMNFSGNGFFQFDAGHILTLGADLVLRGAGRTQRMIRLNTPAPLTTNILRINGRGFTLLDALVEYGNRCQINVTNGATNLNTVTNASFRGSPFGGSNSTALNFIDVTNVTVQSCDFEGITWGININGNGNLIRGIDIRQSNFNLVSYGISIIPTNSINTAATSLMIVGCNFNYAVGNIVLNSGTACRFQNCGDVELIQNTFRGYEEDNQWEDLTAIEIKNTTLIFGSPFDRILDFRTGISAEKGVNNNLWAGGIEINNCETGINMVGGDLSVYANRPYGRVALNCTRLINNKTGIKGKDVYFRGPNNAEDDLGTGNVFQNRADGLLFDICYSFGGPRFFQASDNFWVGGFENAQFNLANKRWNFCQANDNWLRSCNNLTALPTICNQPHTNCCNIDNFATNGKGSGNTFTWFCLMANPNSTTQKSSANKVDKAGLKEEESAESKAKEFSIYPNPANETVNLEMDKGNYHLRVSNAIGQTIFAQNTEGPLSINVATWTNGIYLFELTDKTTNKQQRSKIVVQH